jgi:hypothetical protein
MLTSAKRAAAGLLQILFDVHSITGSADLLDLFITEDRRDRDLTGLRTPSRRPFVEIQSHSAQSGRRLQRIRDNRH